MEINARKGSWLHRLGQAIDAADSGSSRFIEVPAKHPIAAMESWCAANVAAGFMASPIAEPEYAGKLPQAYLFAFDDETDATMFRVMFGLGGAG